MQPQVIKSVKEMRLRSAQLRQAGQKIAFVPTMGYLHEGHLSLVRKARELADVIVVSIYVNPTQFGPNEDLGTYPRDFDRDKRLAASVGADIIFSPTDTEMYPEGYQTSVLVKEVSQGLCGAFRPGHFEGVATVVAKLFNIVQPHLAVFGEKDAQQAIVIQRMVKDLNMDIDIVVAPIVREHDGLAMSSRNEYLTAAERKQATVLFEALRTAKELIVGGERDVDKVKSAMKTVISKASKSRIQYIEIADSINLKPLSRIAGEFYILLAVYIGKTRLIDNIKISIPDKNIRQNSH
jgi:pantoate--beta-alanine ligase